MVILIPHSTPTHIKCQRKKDIFTSQSTFLFPLSSSFLLCYWQMRGKKEQPSSPCFLLIRLRRKNLKTLDGRSWGIYLILYFYSRNSGGSVYRIHQDKRGQEQIFHNKASGNEYIQMVTLIVLLTCPLSSRILIFKSLMIGFSPTLFLILAWIQDIL